MKYFYNMYYLLIFVKLLLYHDISITTHCYSLYKSVLKTTHNYLLINLIKILSPLDTTLAEMSRFFVSSDP